MKLSKLLSVLLVLSLALLAFTAAVAVPILWRGFYYLHIDLLDIPQTTGYSPEVIRAAFDEMQDFCVWGMPFGTGELRYSQEGYSHFVDVRYLFMLDLAVLAVSAVVTAAILLVHRIKKRAIATLCSRSPFFWAGSCTMGFFVLVAALAATDFSRAFVVFHNIFFPGKTNWIFDAQRDEIIRILPETFFMNCAILIVAVLVLICAGYVLYGILSMRRQKAKGDVSK